MEKYKIIGTLYSLKELLSSFNMKVKKARTTYFSRLIDSNKNNSRTLFNTIDKLVSPAPPPVLVFSNDNCELFLSFFINKISDIRSRISPCGALESNYPSCAPILSNFSPVSWEQLTATVSRMCPSTSPLDIVPTFLKTFLTS